MTEQIEQFYPSEIVDIDSIQPWPTNYKIHPDRQVQALGESISSFGQTKNVVAWKGYIVAGHGLWASAKHRGWSKIEVKHLPAEWDEEQVEAYLVADNRTSELAGTDEVLLAGMLGRIQAHEQGRKLLPATGYNEQELGTKMAMIRQHAMLGTMNQVSGMGPMVGKVNLAAANGLPVPQQIVAPPSDEGETAALMGEPTTATYTAPAENPAAAYVQLQFPMVADERDMVVNTLNRVKAQFGLSTSIQALVKLCQVYGGE